MLDSNVSHVLGPDEDLTAGLRERVDAGEVDTLVTHVQVDENLNNPDAEEGRRNLHAMMRAGVRAVATHGFVLDVSRLGSARLSSDEAAARFNAFRGSDARRAKDALIAETALQEGAVLVTGENRKHRRRLRRHFPGLAVWSTDQLRAWLIDGTEPAPEDE